MADDSEADKERRTSPSEGNMTLFDISVAVILLPTIAAFVYACRDFQLRRACLKRLALQTSR